MLNKIVVQYFNKKILKGESSDFFPNKEVFHITDLQTKEVHSIKILDLKAIFFVKDFSGDKDYKEKQDVERMGYGKKIKVSFKDQETLVGYTTGFSPTKSGFYLFPCDPKSNNERIFVVNAATDEIHFL